MEVSALQFFYEGLHLCWLIRLGPCLIRCLGKLYDEIPSIQLSQSSGELEAKVLGDRSRCLG